MTDPPQHHQDDPDALTRRALLARQAAAGAGMLAAGSLLGGALPGEAAAAPTTTLHPQWYPVAGLAPEVDLRGRTAVITGASTGIGRATGEALAARGVHVIGTSRDASGVRRRPPFPLLDLDIASPASVDAFARRVRRRVGPRGHVDILINNAGRGIAGGVLPPRGHEERYFDRLALGMRTDYSGPLMVTAKLLPLLPPSGYARVCFTVSVAAYTVATNALAMLHGYTAMKRALLASANAWRSTLEQQGSHIAVSTVNPFAVNTRFPDNLILTEKPVTGSPTAQYVALLRRSFAGGLPAAMVGEAYVQLLAMRRPPANIAVGAATEPSATMGGNRLTEAAILAENEQAAIRFGVG